MKYMERKCKLGVLSRPDGSALYSEGETAVIAGVYGPVEVKSNKALIDKAIIEANFRPKSGLPGVKDRLNESILREVCAATIETVFYPRSSVVVVVQELQDNGQLLSTTLNAACLAALDSGIDMKYMFAAATSFLTTDGTLELVPPIVGSDIKASLTFVFNSVDKNLIACHTEGSFSDEQYSNALELCRDESLNIFEFIKSSLSIK